MWGINQFKEDSIIRLLFGAGADPVRVTQIRAGLYGGGAVWQGGKHAPLPCLTDHDCGQLALLMAHWLVIATQAYRVLCCRTGGFLLVSGNDALKNHGRHIEHFRYSLLDCIPHEILSVTQPSVMSGYQSSNMAGGELWLQWFSCCINQPAQQGWPGYPALSWASHPSTYFLSHFSSYCPVLSSSPTQQSLPSESLCVNMKLSSGSGSQLGRHPFRREGCGEVGRSVTPRRRIYDQLLCCVIDDISQNESSDSGLQLQAAFSCLPLYLHVLFCTAVTDLYLVLLQLYCSPRSARKRQRQQRRRIDRSMIGEPTNFQHTGHIGSGDVEVGNSRLRAIQNQMQSKGGYETSFTTVKVLITAYYGLIYPHLSRIFILKKREVQTIAKLHFKKPDSFPCFYILETCMFFKSKCKTIKSSDIHPYATRGRDEYRSVRHRTVVHKRLPSQAGLSTNCQARLKVPQC
ncbi:hypothetical protein J6590_031207 [Homalodisca vitripennis]|nr:hypothetical protein J6590_031207 [Homalodisca vitripennis]